MIYFNFCQNLKTFLTSEKNDKENSILDEILAPDQSRVVANPPDFGQIFEPVQEESNTLGSRSTPLKILSPNKRVSAIGKG